MADWIFLIIFALCALWNIIWVGVAIVRYRKRPRRFPRIDPSQIRFRQGFVSGASSKSGDAKAINVLQVTVTDSEVWIRSYFPFNVLETVYQFDHEHRIPLSRIRDIEWGRELWNEVLFLYFENEAGEEQWFKLILPDPRAFTQVIAGQMVQVEDPPPACQKSPASSSQAANLG